MAPTPTSLNMYRGPMVTLQIGTEQHCLLAHESVLVQNPYFQACLQDNKFIEGEKKEIKLPEEALDIMEALIHFLYVGILLFDLNFEEGCLDTAWVRQVRLEIVVKCYIAADRFLMEDMKNQIADALFYHHVNEARFVWPSTIGLLTTAGMRDIPLRRFLIATLAANIIFLKQRGECSGLLQNLECDPDYAASLKNMYPDDLLEVLGQTIDVTTQHDSSSAGYKFLSSKELHTHTMTDRRTQCSITRKKTKEPKTRNQMVKKKAKRTGNEVRPRKLTHEMTKKHRYLGPV